MFSARVCPLCYGRATCAYGECAMVDKPLSWAWWQEVIAGVLVGAGFTAIAYLTFTWTQ